MVGVPCMVMRGGTSKGAFFLSNDLPADPAERDALLIAVMGSPDARQIDGIGGATPLTSKVAVISRQRSLRRRYRLPLPAGQRRPSARERPTELRQPARCNRSVRRRARLDRRHRTQRECSRVHVEHQLCGHVDVSGRRRAPGLRSARQRSMVCPEPRPACSWNSPTSQAAHAAPCFPPDLPSIESMASR